MKAHNEALIGRGVFGPAPESRLGTRIQPAYAVCATGAESEPAKLTPEEIRTIVTARVAASQEVDSLLAIIDRITGTRWEISQEENNR